VGVISVVMVGLARQRFEVLCIDVVAMPVVLVVLGKSECKRRSMIEGAMSQPAQGKKHHRDHQ
jgi:hypothetical protein